jgi:hypothetical protein
MAAGKRVGWKKREMVPPSLKRVQKAVLAAMYAMEDVEEALLDANRDGVLTDAEANLLIERSYTVYSKASAVHGKLVDIGEKVARRE